MGTDGGGVRMNHIEGAILSSFRAGIVAIRSDGAVTYINPIGAKILEGCPLREGESIHPRAGENVFFRVLSEALTMNYLPTRAEADLPGRGGERQSLGFTLSELKERDGRVGICAFFKELTHVEMTEESENLKQRLLTLGQMAAGLAHEIRDDGPGIPPEIQDRIFVPFFTTKKTGTGIGLPLAQKIVHAHGGVLDMNSEVGKGTEFIIKIPMRHGSGR